MGLLGPLRETLNAHRRRKQHSTDGTVAGVSYSQYHRGYNLTVFDAAPVAGPARTVQTYDPNPGQPEFHEPDYQPYEWEMSPQQTPPLRAPLPKFPEPENASPPDYDACPMTDGFLARAIHEVNGGIDGDELLPCDDDAWAQQEARTAESLDELVAGHAPDEPVQEITQAFEQLLQQTAEPSSPEPEQPQPDPFQEQQPYHEQLRMLMDPFGTMGPTGFGPMM